MGEQAEISVAADIRGKDHTPSPPDEAVRAGVAAAAALALRTQGENKTVPTPFERRHADFEIGGYYGPSEVMERCLSLARVYAPLPSPVLICGATGVGKRALAKAIHNGSGRKDKPFVHVDCSNIPPELIASALFGHQKGSFTGAIKDKIGLIAEADGGTLCLDEVENLPPAIQQMLLKASDSSNAIMRIRAVGATREKDYDVRLVCVTNADLEELVRQRKFREDLFQRIAVLQLTMPSLKERGGEYILGIAQHLVREFNREYGAKFGLKSDITIDDDCAAILTQRYPWPGNIRELKNVLLEAYAHAAVIRRRKIIEIADLSGNFLKRMHEADDLNKQSAPADPAESANSAQTKPPQAGAEKTADIDQIAPPTWRETQRRYFGGLLLKTRGKVDSAARIAGLNLWDFIKCCERCGIKPSAFEHPETPQVPK